MSRWLSRLTLVLGPGFEEFPEIHVGDAFASPVLGRTPWGAQRISACDLMRTRSSLAPPFTLMLCQRVLMGNQTQRGGEISTQTENTFILPLATVLVACFLFGHSDHAKVDQVYTDRNPSRGKRFGFSDAEKFRLIDAL